MENTAKGKKKKYDWKQLVMSLLHVWQLLLGFAFFLRETLSTSERFYTC